MDDYELKEQEDADEMAVKTENQSLDVLDTGRGVPAIESVDSRYKRNFTRYLCLIHVLIGLLFMLLTILSPSYKLSWIICIVHFFYHIFVILYIVFRGKFIGRMILIMRRKDNTENNKDKNENTEYLTKSALEEMVDKHWNIK